MSYTIDSLIKLDNKYRLIKVLGAGGFGKVLLAEDELAKNKVAIKTFVNPEFTSEDIVREIQYLASLKHPSIVRFYHHFIENSTLHIVMEYCPNGSLLNYLTDKEKLGIDESLKISLEVANVLKFIHSKNIVHRDIKPGNILLDENKNIKVSDFGIANTHGGTRIYLAPEVYISDGVLKEDPKIDIYALGITLLEMISGKHPFIELEREKILEAKLDYTFIPDDLPQWLQEIILKATHPDPELRFQTAEEFYDALNCRSVPYSVNNNIIKADQVFSLANKYLKQKKWQKSINIISKGFELYEDTVYGNITAGNYYLRIHDLKAAKNCFEKALRLNSGVNIKKSLAEIHLGEGNYSRAILLLQAHIQLNPLDWETYNLLAECYFRMNRFELALEIFDSILPSVDKDCFWNNWMITHMCNKSLNDDIIIKAVENSSTEDIINFNIAITKDQNKSWSGSSLKDKLLYADYRFTKAKNQNTIKIVPPYGKIRLYSNPIVSIGRNRENEVFTSQPSVSRRHCVIVNYPNDVWIYDLSSTLGTYVDGIKVTNKQFLLGKHEIKIGDVRFQLFSSAELLL